MASICEFLIHRGFTRAVIVSVMTEDKGKQAAGEKQGRKPWTLREFGGKTLWDWLQLLIVPVALSLITVGFALWQDTRQQSIENKRAEAERKLAEQRAQDEALQAYLDQMNGLLLERDLRASEVDSEVRTLARARTLTVQTSPLNVRRIGGVTMAGNLALESVPMTQEPHRNRDSKSSAAHCFCHAKYTHVSQTLWRGLVGKEQKHVRRREQGPRPPLVRGFD